MISKQTLYLTADRSAVVAEGDSKAASLLVREGQDITEADCEKYDCLDLVNTKGKTPEPAKPSPREAMPPARPHPQPTPKPSTKKK